MADIPVRPRRTGIPAWVWVLLLVLLAAVIAAVFLFGGEAAEPEARGEADTTAAEVRPYDEAAGRAPASTPPDTTR